VRAASAAVGLLSLLALAPARGLAQGTCGGSPLSLSGFAASSDVQVGEWSEYLTIRDGVPIPTMGFRIFATEAPWNGKTLRWIEIWFDRTGNQAMRATSDEGAEIVLLKRGRTIYSVPPSAKGAQGLCRPPDKNATFDYVVLKTLAGDFHCRHSREVSGDHSSEVWSSNEVQPLQMVKAFFSSGLGYEIIGRGSGAITAFPQRFVAAPLPKADMIKGLLPIDPQAKAKTPCDPADPKCPAHADKGADAKSP
jgi:hypothetical protein